jgi:hypothetical protein
MGAGRVSRSGEPKLFVLVRMKWSLLDWQIEQTTVAGWTVVMGSSPPNAQAF